MMVLKKIATFNGKEFPDFKLKEVTQDASVGLQHYKNLFKPKKIAIRSLIQGYAWYVNYPFLSIPHRLYSYRGRPVRIEFISVTLPQKAIFRIS